MTPASSAPPEPLAAWRVAIAFVAAPAAAAAVAATATPLFGFADRDWVQDWGAYAAGAYLPTLFFGLPVFFVLRHFLALSVAALAVAGAAVAVLPWLLLALGGEPQDGTRALRTLALTAAVGAFGGAVFRVAALGWRR